MWVRHRRKLSRRVLWWWDIRQLTVVSSWTSWLPRSTWTRNPFSPLRKLDDAVHPPRRPILAVCSNASVGEYYQNRRTFHQEDQLTQDARKISRVCDTLAQRFLGALVDAAQPSYDQTELVVIDEFLVQSVDRSAIVWHVCVERVLEGVLEVSSVKKEILFSELYPDLVDFKRKICRRRSIQCSHHEESWSTSSIVYPFRWSHEWSPVLLEWQTPPCICLLFVT